MAQRRFYDLSLYPKTKRAVLVNTNLAGRNDADIQRMRSEEDTLYRRLDKILQALANG
jgi:hypothetical protein